MADIYGIELKDERYAKGHDDEVIFQGDIYLNKEFCGTYSEDPDGGILGTIKAEESVADKLTKIIKQYYRDHPFLDELALYNYTIEQVVEARKNDALPYVFARDWDSITEAGLVDRFFEELSELSAREGMWAGSIKYGYSVLAVPRWVSLGVGPVPKDVPYYLCIDTEDAHLQEIREKAGAIYPAYILSIYTKKSDFHIRPVIDADTTVVATEAHAFHTGGNIWMFYGNLNTGHYFLTDDEGTTMFLDADPGNDIEGCGYGSWQRAHLVKWPDKAETAEFCKGMLTLLKSYNGNDERRGGIFNSELEAYMHSFCGES